MDALIPPDVLRQLQEEARALPKLNGGFTVAQLARALAVGEDRARNKVREMFQAGRLRQESIPLTTEQAHAMGYLRGCQITVYYPTEA